MYSVEILEKDSFNIEASALNTYMYCPRRCYYEYVQQEFESNVYTILGDQVHENVDEFSEEMRRGKIIYKSVKMISEKYNVVVKVDTVEEYNGELYPVEYKRGKKGFWQNDKYQLGLQAMVLEEKIGKPVDKGFLYYVESKDRIEIEIDDKLRQKIIEIIQAIKNLYSTMKVPDAVYDMRCKYCSIKNICLPMEVDIIKKGIKE